jgi:hypothetical protein
MSAYIFWLAIREVATDMAYVTAQFLVEQHAVCCIMLYLNVMLTSCCRLGSYHKDSSQKTSEKLSSTEEQSSECVHQNADNKL